MLSEIKSSFKSVLSDRLTSPLYGTLIVSWLIWNWKIVYVTLFVSADTLYVSKLFYIEENLLDPWTNIVWPLASSAFLIVLAPLIANGAYWMSIKYTAWRKGKQDEVLKSERLTVEESLKLKTDYNALEISFEQYKNTMSQQLAVARQTVERYDRERRKLKILKAWYGAEDNWVEVEKLLKSRIADNSIETRASNESMQTDPAPGRAKKLQVVYSLYDQIHYEEVMEGMLLKIVGNTGSAPDQLLSSQFQ